MRNCFWDGDKFLDWQLISGGPAGPTSRLLRVHVRQLLQVINLLDEFLAKKAKHNIKWGPSVARQDGTRCRRWTLKPTMSAPRSGVTRRTRATVLLNARGAQTRKAVGFKRTLPGEEFLLGGVVAT